MREEEQRYHSKMFSGFGSARIKGGGLFLMALYSRASRVVYRFTLDIVNKKPDLFEVPIRKVCYEKACISTSRLSQLERFLFFFLFLAVSLA